MAEYRRLKISNSSARLEGIVDGGKVRDSEPSCTNADAAELAEERRVVALDTRKLRISVRFMAALWPLRLLLPLASDDEAGALLGK